MRKAMPDFLALPARPAKPRDRGLTHVLDSGLPRGGTEDLLATIGGVVDVWKFGWGTAYVDPGSSAKVESLAAHGVRACVGGTLLEIAWLQGKVEAFLDWAARLGFPSVEVSNGAIDIPLAEKRRLIAQAAERFEVVAEVGSKNPGAPVSAALWADEAAGDLLGGASWVLAEGRESGRVGLYHPDGRAREDVVRALVDAVGTSRLVFEAPRKNQQAWFIRQFGPQVNLANVALGDVLGLEALRLGLRADTLDLLRSGTITEAT